MDPQRAFRLRTMLVYGALLLFALAIAVQLFTIQLVEGERWTARAEHVATAYRTVQPDRGHIYSEDGRLLSTSVPEYEVRMDMMADGLSDELLRAEIDELCQALSDLFGDRTAAEYRQIAMRPIVEAGASPPAMDSYTVSANVRSRRTTRSRSECQQLEAAGGSLTKMALQTG